MGVGVPCERGTVTGELTHADNSAKLTRARRSDFDTRTHLDRLFWNELELKLTFLSSVHRQGMLIPLPGQVLPCSYPTRMARRFPLQDSKRDTIIVACPAIRVANIRSE